MFDHAGDAAARKWFWATLTTCSTSGSGHYLSQAAHLEKFGATLWCSAKPPERKFWVILSFCRKNFTSGTHTTSALLLYSRCPCNKVKNRVGTGPLCCIVGRSPWSCLAISQDLRARVRWLNALSAESEFTFLSGPSVSTGAGFVICGSAMPAALHSRRLSASKRHSQPA